MQNVVHKALQSNMDLQPKTYDWNALPQSVPDAEGLYAVAVPGKTLFV
jgi:myo-inositol 2-dehydrogenase / D-chiro-inositol 1-dehydrogenase